jgi:peptidoglycan DL-endopeptidase CwlO
MFGVAAFAVLAPATAVWADPSPSTIDKQIDTAQTELEKVIESYNKVTEDLKATQAASTDLAARMQPLQDDLDRAYAKVNQIAAAAYMGQSGMRTVSLLLSAGSSDTFVDQLTALRHISQSQQQDITGYTEKKRKLDAEKKQLDQLLADQSQQKADLQTKAASIEADIKKLEDMQKAAAASGRRTTTTAPVNAGPPPPVSGRAGAAVRYAYAQLGKPYKWAGAGPNSFDCSGLTMMAWKAAGVSLPHNAAMQWSAIRHVSRSSLAPGDLVFFNSLGHVGIYIGNGNMIHAPHTGDVVRVASIDHGDTYYGAGRPGEPSSAVRPARASRGRAGPPGTMSPCLPGIPGSTSGSPPNGAGRSSTSSHAYRPRSQYGLWTSAADRAR